MDVARLYAQRATCPRKQVGAVMVRDNRVVAVGYNGAPPGRPHCRTPGAFPCTDDEGCANVTHAEANLLAFAARHGVQTLGASMYTTCSPCVPCARLIAAAGVARVFFEEMYRDQAGLDLLRDCTVDWVHVP